MVILLRSSLRSLQLPRRTIRSIGTVSDNSVTIDDITVENPPIGTAPHLIPRLPLRLDFQNIESSIPPCHLSHLRWMLQKDLVLQQDFLLLGLPNLARERRQLILLYASLLGREIEYVSLSKDTSEADLKQRKEVTNNGTIYTNQAPVRAAINGRLLVLDGLEKAERNLPLDDGTMLLSPDVRGEHPGGIPVHPDFRVAALGTIAEDDGTIALDPPLRSRFQARLAHRAISNGLLDTDTLKYLMKTVGGVSGGVSLDLIHNAVRYLEQYQDNITPRAALNAHGISLGGEMIETYDIVAPFEVKTVTAPKMNRSSYIETTTTKAIGDLILAGFESGNSAVALVGPKGCYKSTVAKDIVEKLDLHPDITARDLLQSRGTDERGDTIWRDTPLTRAARSGKYVIMDGIDKLRSDTMSSLAMLLERGWAVLPDGTSFYANDKFRCIAIAHPPSEKSWITPEIKTMFHWINAKPLPRDELQEVLSGLFPNVSTDTLEKILNLQEYLNNVIVDSDAEKEAMQLSLRKIKHICRRADQNPEELGSIIHNCLMTSFLPELEQNIVEKCLARCGIVTNDNKFFENFFSQQYSFTEDPLLNSCKRSATNPLLVPNVEFFPNPMQENVMRQVLVSHSVGERALLITGYQGVGKNKIVDNLLSHLNCEREYTQLHRDTTIQSLMLSPSVEDGKIVFNDSPLIRAAKNGRILVLDEADKAPTEVVALLKGLIEDGQLSLPDGRVLCYDESDVHGSNHIKIHPDFRIWALTNPAVFPFQGNDLSRHMSDVFACHIVPPMDEESHRRILTSYGKGVHPDVINKLVKVWEDLRVAHETGVISYIFSVRESVSIVKHLSAFPDEGVQTAIENVLAFDPSSPKHGKEDPDNTPHVGGNTWAGGTGGSDTAGLGGRGGPYRLDKGHPIHQISDEMKAQVSEEAKQRAKEMANEALAKKLEELNMGKLDWERYNSVRARVEENIKDMKRYLKDLKKRKEERQWLHRQTSGELDENRLVEVLAGERDVFKRRGNPADRDTFLSNPINIKLVVDVSASMYRFGYDGRLERLLEATLMIMECFKGDKRFNLHITGHNGSSPKIDLVHPSMELDEATQLRVLENHTIEAIEVAVEESAPDTLVIAISDANLNRYDITLKDLKPLQSAKVHAHLIFIASLGDEAAALDKAVPNERAQCCMNTSDLPLIIKKIVTSALK
ncbi:vWA domain-containing protein [Skeletonema marinoi]|uniref:VWA domain-containing protein n=1 Tax=Skeletonema marinoi TaxID=267567 RepID=A0AAD9DHX6_9STRA|nr:vWA domain-containing protein [Skeletonema marinoi]